jgi:hypothetical protein
MATISQISSSYCSDLSSSTTSSSVQPNLRSVHIHIIYVNSEGLIRLHFDDNLSSIFPTSVPCIASSVHGLEVGCNSSSTASSDVAQLKFYRNFSYIFKLQNNFVPAHRVLLGFWPDSSRHIHSYISNISNHWHSETQKEEKNKYLGLAPLMLTAAAIFFWCSNAAS